MMHGIRLALTITTPYLQIGLQMANLLVYMKDWIRRLAKKEIRADLGSTKKAVSQYRRDIASLKRQVHSQSREISFLKSQEKKRLGQPTATATAEPIGRNSLLGTLGLRPTQTAQAHSAAIRQAHRCSTVDGLQLGEGYIPTTGSSIRRPGSRS